MEHLLDGPLPGCETLEAAEEHHRLDAMQMELRERRTRYPDRAVSIKEIELHCDGLRKDDPDVYVTYLYVRSRLGAVFSHLTDEQFRRSLTLDRRAAGHLAGDREILDAVHAYRSRGRKATPEILAAVKGRVQALLPGLCADIERSAAEAYEEPELWSPRWDADDEERDDRPQPYLLPREDALPPHVAVAAFRMRALIYLRHPLDLIREISRATDDQEDQD